MKETIKTYKNFSDVKLEDIVRVYGKFDKKLTSQKPAKEFLFWDLEVDHNENRLEVIQQAPRRKLTKEWILDRKLSEFPLKYWQGYYVHHISTSSIEHWLDNMYYGNLFIDPPLPELIEVSLPYPKEEPKKTLKVKIKTWKELEKISVKSPSGNYLINDGISFNETMEALLPKDRIIEVEISLRWKTKDYTFIIAPWMIDSESTWLVKSIKGISEVSGEYTLEKLRKEYPNCLYKESSKEDWLE